MLNTANIVREKQREKKSFLKFNDEIDESLLEEMNFFEKKKYAHYARLLKELTSKIESSSGWKYIGKSFVQLSDYGYDPTSEQITFERNEIKLICNKVETMHKNKRERSFLNRYESVLLRIAEIKTKKSIIELDAYEKQLRKDMPISYIVPKYSDPEKEAQEVISVQNETEEFLKEFGVKGIAALISYLNSLANSKQPLDLYSRIDNLKLSPEKKLLFLKWLERYSTGGEQLLLCYNNNNKNISVEERQKELKAHR